MIVECGPRIELKDENLMNLFFFLYLLNPTNRAKKSLVMVEKDVEDLHLRFHGRPESSDFLQIGLIVFGDLFLCALIECLLKLNRASDTIKFFLNHLNFEVMDEFSLPNVEAHLASFISNTISYFRAEH